MGLFGFFKRRSSSGPLGQLDNKIAALLDRLSKQVANPGDQAPSESRRIYENVVGSQKLSAPQEYYVLLITLTALDGPQQHSASDLAQVVGRVYTQRMRHEEMTGDDIGPAPELLAAKLVPAYQEAQAQGLSVNDVRDFLYRRVERFKTLTELEQALAIAKKVGAEPVVTKARSVITKMTAALK